MIQFINMFRDFLKKLKKDRVSAYSAQAAYFIMLSFIPFIMLLLMMIKFTPITKADFLKSAIDIMPDSLDPLMLNIIDEVYNKSVAIISVTAITAIWSAGRGMMAVMGGLNSVYGLEESRNYIILRIHAIFYTVAFIVIIILTLLLQVFGNAIYRFLQSVFPLAAAILGMILSFRLLITLSILMLFFLLLFYFVPNRKAKFIEQLPGAIFASVGWSLFSFGFSVYVDYAHGVTNMYGSLTTMILLMLWLYFCMYIIFLSGEINDVLQRERLQRG